MHLENGTSLRKPDAEQPAQHGRVAVKDTRLVYRACSLPYAQVFGRQSPADLIGHSDFDFLPALDARNQAERDGLTMLTREPDISQLEVVGKKPVFVVRTPIIASSGDVTGIDLHLVADEVSARNLTSEFLDKCPAHRSSQRTRSNIKSFPAVSLADNSQARPVVQKQVAGGRRGGSIPADRPNRTLNVSLNSGGNRTAGNTPGKPVRRRSATTGADNPDSPVPVVTRRAAPGIQPRTNRPLQGRRSAVASHERFRHESAALINYRLLVDNGLQGSLVIRDDTILYANAVALSILGYRDAGELINSRRVSALFPKEDWKRICRHAHPPHGSHREAVSQQFAVSAFDVNRRTLTLVARSQELFWHRDPALLVSFVEFDAQQQPVDQQLRMNEQRYRHYARASADFFWELDERLRFSFLSREGGAILGQKNADELIGQTHEHLLAFDSMGDDEEHWAPQLERLRKHQPFRDFEFSWQVGDELKTLRYSGIPVYDSEHRFMGYRGTGCDVTAANKLAESIAYQASHDALTGLVNRRQFEVCCRRALEKARTERATHALCFMDLDSFKIVNDTCGHLAGDELLRQLSSLLGNLVRKSDVLARLGGDEFGVMLYNCSVAVALKLANQIRSEIENFNFLWEGNRFQVGVSIGLVVVDDRWASLQALFSAADSACYLAKNEGRNRVTVYREGEGHASNRKVETHWVEEINSALDQDRIVLATQEIARASGAGTSKRVEVLARLMSRDGTIVNPKAFLPSAERYGLSQALDRRVLELTLQWYAENPRLLRNLKLISINLTSSSFADPTFAEYAVTQIERAGLPPGRLCFELTETSTIANLSAASAFMHRMDEAGCRIMLDDFGSGLSSFGYMKELPVDFLKIDGLLIRDILNDPIDFTMVKAINELSQALGQKTIAKFVETPELMEAVREIGVDFVQGYQIGRPEIVSF